MSWIFFLSLLILVAVVILVTVGIGFLIMSLFHRVGS